MTPEQRLGQIADALEAAGLECGDGRARRPVFGVGRNTVDFRFLRCSVFGRRSARRSRPLRPLPVRPCRARGLPGGPRTSCTLRFGACPTAARNGWSSGCEITSSRILANSAPAKKRGIYGDREIGFLSLGDLLGSKETERESDWMDIALLEEIQDARHLSKAVTRADLEVLLSHLQSRRGFEQPGAVFLTTTISFVKQSRGADAPCRLPICSRLQSMRNSP